MARKEGASIEADVGGDADFALTENEWRWIKVLRIICDGEVPAPKFPTGMSMKEFSGSKEGDGH